MSTSTRTDQRIRWARVARPAVYLLGITAAAVALPAMAFGTASGEAIEIAPDYFDTSELVMNFNWWWAAYLLVVPVYLTARRYPRLAASAALITAVPQCITAHVFVIRFAETGWGDGLEAFAYLYAFAMTVLFVGAAVLGGVIANRRRRRRATPPLVDAAQ